MRIFLILLFALSISSCSSDEKMVDNGAIEGITIGRSINEVEKLDDYNKITNSLNGVDFSVYSKAVDHEVFSEVGVLVIDTIVHGIVYLREMDDYFNSDRVAVLIETLMDQYGKPKRDTYIDNIERVITFNSEQQAYNTIIVSHSNYSTIEAGPQFVLALMYGTSKMQDLNELIWRK